MLHCPFLLPRSCSRRFPGGTRSVSTIVAAASMSSLRNATLAMGANRRLSPVSYSSCVSLHLNDEIMRIVYYALRNMSMGKIRNHKSNAQAVGTAQTGLLQGFRGGCPRLFRRTFRRTAPRHIKLAISVLSPRYTYLVTGATMRFRTPRATRNNEIKRIGFSLHDQKCRGLIIVIPAECCSIDSFHFSRKLHRPFLL